MPAERAARALAMTSWLLFAGCGGGGDDDNGAAVPMPVVAPAAAATCGLPRFAETALARVNEHRARGADCGTHGRYGAAPPLIWNDLLAAAATAHSEDMAARDYFAHTSPEGGTMSERVDATGYRWSALGENLAAGYRSIETVIDGWIDSDGHCVNVMNPALREMGMACVASDSATYSTYWTMNAGRPR